MIIRFKLSRQDIQAAIQKTREVQETFIREKCDEFAKRLAMEGAKAAREALVKYGAVDTRDLLSSVGYDCIRPGLWRVYCYAPNQNGDNYAWFVEFGTGDAGANSKAGEYRHPEAASVGWKYDSHGHGEDGWFYPNGKSMKHKYRFTANGQRLPWTSGERAKPFMYDARRHMQDTEVYNRIMKEVFGRD